MKLDQSLKKCIFALKKKSIIAYPTESVFGLGCDPDSKDAVFNLLILKRRPIEKGFILIAANYQQLIPYIEESKLSYLHIKKILSYSSNLSTTWIVPVSSKTPYWIKGNFNSIAIRIINHIGTKKLCLAFKKPLISTSANILGETPCRTFKDVQKKFGKNFPLLMENTGNRKNPSEIRNIYTNELIRAG